MIVIRNADGSPIEPVKKSVAPAEPPYSPIAKVLAAPVGGRVEVILKDGRHGTVSVDASGRQDELKKALKRFEKAVGRTSAPASATVNDTYSRPTTPTQTLDGGHVGTDAGRYEPQPYDSSPDEFRARQQAEARAGGYLEPVALGAAGEQEGIRRFREGVAALNRVGADGSGLVGKSADDMDARGYLSEEDALANRPRQIVPSGTDAVSKLVQDYVFADLRKNLAQRERRHARPISKAVYAIKEARITKGWSQKRLAVELGVTPSLISKIESDQQPVSGTMALEMAELFGKDLAWAKDLARRDDGREDHTPNQWGK